MLNSNSVLKNAFGKDVLNSYMKLKKSEIESFINQKKILINSSLLQNGKDRIP